jgi:hypothetical protein
MSVRSERGIRDRGRLKSEQQQGFERRTFGSDQREADRERAQQRQSDQSEGDFGVMAGRKFARSFPRQALQPRHGGHSKK